MREHLVGYLLGVLDDAEHERVREDLERDPQLRQDLERIQSRLVPLQVGVAEFDPPPGLTERTCARVAELASRSAPIHRRAAMAAGAGGSWGRFTAADAVVAVGVVLAAALLFFPAIANSRYQSQVVACQNNLRQLGVALRQYSLEHEGYFPFVPGEGPRAAAGVYAPTLADAGLLEEPNLLLCPASSQVEQADQFRVPSLQELDQARGPRLAKFHRTMGGSFGYGLGYRDNGRLCAIKDCGRNHFVIMSDMPQLTPHGGNSTNHGGNGQNVLYENMAVKFLLTCLEQESGDDFFVSDRGRVEAGLHRDDSVIANSAVPPILTPVKSIGESDSR